jgi:hypothetical protein
MAPNTGLANGDVPRRPVTRKKLLALITLQKCSKRPLFTRYDCAGGISDLDGDQSIVTRRCPASRDKRAAGLDRKASLGPRRIPVDAIARGRGNDDGPIEHFDLSGHRPRRAGQKGKPAAARLTSGERQNGAGQSQSAAGDHFRDPYRCGSLPWRRDGSRRRRQSSRRAGRISRARHWHSWSGADLSNWPCGRPARRRSDQR